MTYNAVPWTTDVDTPTSAEPLKALAHCAKRRAEDKAAKMAREAFDENGDISIDSDSILGDGFDDNNRTKTVSKTLADQPKVSTEEQVRGGGLHRVVVLSTGYMGLKIWLDPRIIPKLDAMELPAHLRPFVSSSSIRQVKAANLEFDPDSFASALLAEMTYETTTLEGPAHARACDQCAHFNKVTKSYRPGLVATKAGTNACQPCVDGHRACSLDPLAREGLTNDFKIWLFATLPSLNPAGSVYTCPPFAQLVTAYESVNAPNKVSQSAQDKVMAAFLVMAGVNTGSGSGSGGGGHLATASRPLPRPFPRYERPTNPPSDELNYVLAYHEHVENEALRTSFEVPPLSGKPSNGTKRHSSGRAKVSSKASGSKSKVNEKVSGDIKGKAKAEDDDFILISSSSDE